VENLKTVQESKLILEQIEAERQEYHQKLEELAKVEQAREGTEKALIAQKAQIQATLTQTKDPKQYAEIENGQLKMCQSALSEAQKGRQDNLEKFRTIFRKLAELSAQQQPYTGDGDKEKTVKTEFAGKDLLGKMAFVESLAKTPETFNTNGNVIQSIWEFEKAEAQKEHQTLVEKRAKTIEQNAKTDPSMVAERVLAKTSDYIRDTRRQYQKDLKTILGGLVETCKRLPVEGISQPLPRDGFGKQQRSDGLGKALIDLQDLRIKARHLYEDSLEAFAREKDKADSKKDDQDTAAKAKFRAMDLLDQIMFVEGLVKAINTPLSEQLIKLVEDYAKVTEDVQIELQQAVAGQNTFLTGLQARRAKGDTLTVSDYDIYKFTQKEESLGKTLATLVLNKRDSARKYCADAANKLSPIVKRLLENSFEDLRKQLADLTRDYEVLMLDLAKEVGEASVALSGYCTDANCTVPEGYKPSSLFSVFKKPSARELMNSYVDEQIEKCQKTLKIFGEKGGEILADLVEVKKKLETLKSVLSSVPFTLSDDTGVPTLQFTLQDTHGGVKTKFATLEGLIKDAQQVRKTGQPVELRKAARSAFLQKLPDRDMVVLVDPVKNPARDLSLGKEMPEYVGKVGEKPVTFDDKFGIFEFASLAPRMPVKSRRLSAESKEQQQVKPVEDVVDEHELTRSGVTSPDSGDAEFAGEDEHENSERKESERPRRLSSATTSFDRPKTAATPVPLEVPGKPSPSSSQTTASSVAVTPPATGNKAQPRTSVFGGLFKKKPQAPVSGTPAAGSSSQQRSSVSVGVQTSSRPSVSQAGFPATTQAATFSGASSTVTSSSSKASATTVGVTSPDEALSGPALAVQFDDVHNAGVQLSDVYSEPTPAQGDKPVANEAEQFTIS
jgi:hypothetical protein